MDNNNDDSRQNRDRLEDNPFVAFRRFADSQVSSLLNIVFTIPATIANHNNAHHAREACLFKKADKAPCDALQKIEDEIAGLRSEGRELYKAGDLQEMLKKSEELMMLDRQADHIRRQVVEQSTQGTAAEDEKCLVQRVANKKGQEWGWDWSWGFPAPFDDDRSRRSEGREEQQREALELLKNRTKYFLGDEAWDEAMKFVDILDASPMFRAMISENAWDEFSRGAERSAGMRRDAGHAADGWLSAGNEPGRSSATGSTGYSPNALAENGEMNKAGVDWRAAYEDLVRAEQESERARHQWQRRHGHGVFPKRVPCMDEEVNDEPSYEYSHDHEDQHDDPPTPKTKQGGFLPPPYDATRRITESQETSGQDDLRAFLAEQQQHGRHLSLRSHCPIPFDAQDEDSAETAENEDQIFKFLLSQQQNGRHLGLKDCPFPSAEDNSAHADEQTETELDVYEHVLSKPQSPETPHPAQRHDTHEPSPSILSTLTTTERTVAPDGSITTKVVLKKRFADGREESSETVHTQRGQETGQTRDPWAALQKSLAPRDRKEDGDVEPEKGKKSGGWFWSS